LPDEIHLLHIALVADDGLSRLVDPAVEIDDQLIDKSSLALLKKVVKAPLELFKTGKSG